MRFVDSRLRFLNMFVRRAARDVLLKRGQPGHFRRNPRQRPALNIRFGALVARVPRPCGTLIISNDALQPMRFRTSRITRLADRAVHQCQRVTQQLLILLVPTFNFPNATGHQIRHAAVNFRRCRWLRLPVHGWKIRPSIRELFLQLLAAFFRDRGPVGLVRRYTGCSQPLLNQTSPHHRALVIVDQATGSFNSFRGGLVGLAIAALQCRQQHPRYTRQDKRNRQYNQGYWTLLHGHDPQSTNPSNTPDSVRDVAIIGNYAFRRSPTLHGCSTDRPQSPRSVGVTHP